VVEEECPEPKGGEVRVKVLAAGVSLPDLLMREGVHPETPRLPFTPGWDLVGVVERLGSGVSGIQPGQIVAALIREIAGGAALGLGAGWLAIRLIRLVKDDGLELMISLALVLGCYRLASLSDVSGPISVVAAGLCVGSLLTRPASDTGTRSALIGFWGLLGQFLNTMLFLLIGLQILGLSMRPVDLLQMTFAIPLAILSRMLSVAIPWGLTRDDRRNKARDVAVLTWTGLRGGISLALALTLPASPWRADLLVVCYAVVVFTIVAQGLAMHRFLQAMYAEH